MSNAQIYCSVAELMTDLRLNGDEPRLMQRIKEASQFMVRNLGRFIPVTETRALQGVPTETLDLGAPLLSISAVRVDGVAVVDYTPWPASRCWENGPYTWLTRSAGWGQAVEIDGQWGLYDDRQDMGITISQLIESTALVVSDGSLLSPGMVLLVGSEQELIIAGNGGERSPAPTAAVSLLNGAIDNASEEITVDNGAEFFAGEVLQIGTEDLYVRKVGGNQLVCSRGWNSTTKGAHVNDAPIAVYRTYTVLRAVNGTTAVAHTNQALQRYLPPADVHWLALQIAALMRQKALTAFGGRAGNSDLGETFYVNEFPRQIADVRSNYSIPYL
ncbi:MAG TPA: hypothetical protein VN364_08135 [Bellilinea sp.]|nr:hypothetical protein [Bellilinea sp.]